MIISVCVYIVEYYKFKESLHINHPSGHILSYCDCDIFETSCIFESLSIILFISACYSRKILHSQFVSIWQNIKAFCDIYPLSILGETQAVSGSDNAIYLRSNLHGQVLIYRDELAI